MENLNSYIIAPVSGKIIIDGKWSKFFVFLYSIRINNKLFIGYK